MGFPPSAVPLRAGRTGKGIYANFTLKLAALGSLIRVSTSLTVSLSLAPGNDVSKVSHGSSEWEKVVLVTWTSSWMWHQMFVTTLKLEVRVLQCGTVGLSPSQTQTRKAILTTIDQLLAPMVFKAHYFPFRAESITKVIIRVWHGTFKLVLVLRLTGRLDWCDHDGIINSQADSDKM